MGVSRKIWHFFTDPCELVDLGSVEKPQNTHVLKVKMALSLAIFISFNLFSIKILFG